MEKNTFFTDLYSKQYNAQKLYAYRKLGDLDDAEDVVQEVFCTALEKIDMLLGSENPEAWLMQTLKYKVQNKLRENYKRISRVSNLSDSVQYGVEMKFECDEDEGRWEYHDRLTGASRFELPDSNAENGFTLAALFSRLFMELCSTGRSWRIFGFAVPSSGPVN